MKNNNLDLEGYTKEELVQCFVKYLQNMGIDDLAEEVESGDWLESV